MILVCGSTNAGDPGVSFHQFLANPEKKAVWLGVFQIDESDVKPYFQVCSRHFLDGNAKNKR